MRCTTMVRNGSFAEASANASFARSWVTPSISKMILPGWISHTKYSGLPLPLPMRTSAGFCDTGLSGNTRIQMRPPRLMWRELARRQAAARCRLQAVLAEGHLGPARGVARIAALLLLAVLGSCRLQHDLFLLLSGVVLDDLLGLFHRGLGRGHSGGRGVCTFLRRGLFVAVGARARRPASFTFLGAGLGEGLLGALRLG